VCPICDGYGVSDILKFVWKLFAVLLKVSVLHKTHGTCLNHWLIILIVVAMTPGMVIPLPLHQNS